MSRRRTRRAPALALALTTAVALFGACSSDEPDDAAETTETTETTESAPTTAADETSTTEEEPEDEMSFADLMPDEPEWAGWAANLEAIDEAVFDGGIIAEFADRDLGGDLFSFALDQCADYIGGTADGVTIAFAENIDGLRTGYLAGIEDDDRARVVAQVLSITLIYEPGPCDAAGGADVDQAVRDELRPVMIDGQDQVLADALRAAYPAA